MLEEEGVRCAVLGTEAGNVVRVSPSSPARCSEVSDTSHSYVFRGLAVSS